MWLLNIDSVTHTFLNGVDGIKNINCVFSEAELIAIVGQNGAGKSLLAAHICGLAQPTSGALYIDNATNPATSHQLRMISGMVFQQAEHQVVGHTVIDDILFGLRNIGIPPQEGPKIALDTLARLGIDHMANRYIDQLSGGELRRVALAAILVLNPRLLILDEPFAHLDWHGTQSLLHTIAMLQKKGHTILILTHELHKIAPHVSRVIVLHKGEVQAEGSVEQCRPVLQQLHIAST